MPLYTLTQWALAMILAVTVYWPFNIPLMVLCFRIRHGGGELPHEPGPLWGRSACAALGLAVFSGIMLLLNTWLVDTLTMPQGPIHTILFMLYLPAGVFFLFWIMAFEDFGEALSLLLLYIFVPGFLLLFIDRYLRFWQPVLRAFGWLEAAPL